MPTQTLPLLSSLLRRLRSVAAPLLALVSLASCRLYEPARYQRLQFAPGRPQTRVLMIGDSLTYYNDLPGLLQQFSAGESAPIYLEQATAPLASLRFHWTRDKSVDRIRDGRFDFVILQDFSRKPVTDPDGALQSFLQFDAEIRKAGGKTIVFQNWTRRGLQDDYPALLNTYHRIVEQTGARLAPIGAAWKRCAAERPDITLLLDDRHPTDAGSYLAACVLYDVLYHKKSADLPTGIPGPKLSENVLTALRAIADRTVYASSP
jgi:hypothetical protein